MKYKYELTNKIDNYIKKCDEIYITKNIISNNFKDDSDQKIYKALSDINKAGDISRKEQGVYLNNYLLGSLKEFKVEVAFKKLIKHLTKDKEDLSQEVAIKLSSSYLAFNHGLSTQTVSEKYIIIDKNNRNISLAEEARKIISHTFGLHENKIKIYLTNNKNDLFNFIYNIVQNSRRPEIKELLKIAKYYDDFFKIEETNKETGYDPLLISNILYGKVSIEQYEEILSKGYDKYSLKLI